MAAQIGRVHEFTVLGVADVAKRELIECTGAAFIGSGSGVADRVREVASSVDLIVDLVGGDALRAVADLVADPGRIISAADPDAAVELGGRGLARTTEAMGKITEVIQYGLVDPMRTPSTTSMTQVRRSQPWRPGTPAARSSWFPKADQPCRAWGRVAYCGCPYATRPSWPDLRRC